MGDDEKQQIGFYSAQHAAMSGTVFWATPDGGEVEVTGVLVDPDVYKWPDKENRGPVTHWVRSSPERMAHANQVKFR